MQLKTKWSPGPGAKVLGVALTDDDGWVVSATGPAFGICPDCGRRTGNRSLQDLPVQGKTVTVKLRLSRWRCYRRDHLAGVRIAYRDSIAARLMRYDRSRRRAVLDRTASALATGNAYFMALITSSVTIRPSPTALSDPILPSSAITLIARG